MTALEHLYDKSYVCLICSNTFTSKKVRSRFVKTLKYDTDFAPVYAEGSEDTSKYYVNVCPMCGYSFTDEFSTHLSEDARDEIENKVWLNWVYHDFGNQRAVIEAIDTFKLASYCSILKKESHVVTAGLYLRLVWLYRELGEQVQERRFTRMALDEYVKSYELGDFQNTKVSELKIMYLIGELNRKLGNIDVARKYFSKVIEQQKNTIEKNVINMAKDRWEEMRVM